MRKVGAKRSLNRVAVLNEGGGEKGLSENCCRGIVAWGVLKKHEGNGRREANPIRTTCGEYHIVEAMNTDDRRSLGDNTASYRR